MQPPMLLLPACITSVLWKQKHCGARRLLAVFLIKLPLTAHLMLCKALGVEEKWFGGAAAFFLLPPPKGALGGQGSSCCLRHPLPTCSQEFRRGSKPPREWQAGEGGGQVGRGVYLFIAKGTTSCYCFRYLHGKAGLFASIAHHCVGWDIRT